jgi:hypothetical protein
LELLPKGTLVPKGTFSTTSVLSPIRTKAPVATLSKGLDHQASMKSFESLSRTVKSRKRWPQDFSFNFDDICEERRRYLRDSDIHESTFECLLKEVKTKDNPLIVNDLLVNEFYSLINEDCKRQKKPLLMLNSFVLPSLIERKSNPDKFKRIVKK